MSISDALRELHDAIDENEKEIEAEAIAAERERCARMIETDDGPASDFNQGMDYRNYLAAKIRSGE